MQRTAKRAPERPPVPEEPKPITVKINLPKDEIKREKYKIIKTLEEEADDKK